MGVQYTPVLSMATLVTAHCFNQSLSFIKSPVMVENVRISLCCGVMIQALTLFLCTSIPQQCEYTTSMSALPKIFRQRAIRPFRYCYTYSLARLQFRVPTDRRFRLVVGLMAPNKFELSSLAVLLHFHLSG